MAPSPSSSPANHLPCQRSPPLPEQYWPGACGESLPSSRQFFSYITDSFHPPAGSLSTVQAIKTKGKNVCDNFNEGFIIIVVVSSYHTLSYAIQQNRVSLYYNSGSCSLQSKRWQAVVMLVVLGKKNSSFSYSVFDTSFLNKTSCYLKI